MPAPSGPGTACASSCCIRAPATTAAKPNALSCVLRVAGAQGSALLAGDSKRRRKRALVARRRRRLASDVLIVPHHGSRTSSSDEWLDAVMPRVAVVQAGYRNRFGHPAPAVVERYAARGIKLVRSDCMRRLDLARERRLDDLQRETREAPGAVGLLLIAFKTLPSRSCAPLSRSHSTTLEPRASAACISKELAPASST